MIFLQFLILREGCKSSGRNRLTHLALASTLAVLLAPASSAAGTPPVLAASPTSLHARRGAVASDSELASRAGAELLRAGGNAADAACATALALGVVHPFASGLGGGGFALVYLAGPKRAVALDFRETAPAGLRAPGGAIPPRSAHSVGVPGEAAGLDWLVRRYGALPFSRCVAPALRLARGFPASPWLVTQIKDELARHPGDAEALFGKLFDLRGRRAAEIRAGDRLARPQLARTLKRLRTRGARGFYTGPTAKAIVAAVGHAGMSLDDLAGYRPLERTPLESTLDGKRVLLLPPPSAGGVLVSQVLGIIAEHASRGPLDPSSPDYLHLLAEAGKHGFADRARFLGDPGFVHVPLERLLDPAYHRELSARVRLDRVLAHDAYGTPAPRPSAPARDGGTAHLSVLDRHGNAVALTTTVNLELGARIVAGDSGVLLNDELDDFAPPAGQPDVFALTGGAANRPAPGKRPLSSMSPTLVLDERGVLLVTGAAGGPRIVSATVQLLLGVLRFGRGAREAVAAPRIHHQWEPDVLWVEPGLPAETVRALAARGHRIEQRADVGKANLLLRTPTGLEAAADPRSGGAPAGH